MILLTTALGMVSVTVAAPPGALISSLPGQPNVTFKQYSGYITVDESHGRNLFYYFAEAVNASATTPLALWLNGGPGCSSLGGAFSELGPFYPNATGDGLIVNDYAWNQVANVLFLESPAGVGFSYSNDTSDYSTGDAKTAQDSLAFILGWLQEYPEYNSTDFYIIGESYAGHYIPQLATVVLQNNKVPGQAQINLKGIMIGNPLFDPSIDLDYAHLEYAWGHGMISEDTHDAIVQNCNYSAPDYSPACYTAQADGYTQSGYLSSYLNPYDVLTDVCITSGSQAFRLMNVAGNIADNIVDNFTADPCIEEEMNTYLNIEAVQSSLHAVETEWDQCTSSIDYSGNDSNILIAPILANLVNSSLKVWIYSGDADMVIPVIGTRQIVNTLAKSLSLEAQSTYGQWYQGCQIGGWTITWGKLVYATVRGAGHMVPGFQPARSLQLFTSFLGENSTLPSIAACL